MIKALIFFILLSILLFYIAFRLWKKIRILSFDKKSLSTKYGKMTEQFFPFLSDYPYKPGNFKFIGNPIDGIQFEDDKIIFVEFKTASSNLSERQSRIKEIVQNKKIEWQEIRI